MNILENEFIHIGTNKIYKELWQNIRMDQTYSFITKPYGGLYCSNINEEFCDWLSYVKTEKYNYYDYVSSKPACFIKLKKDTKILKIEKQEDIIYLKNYDLIINLENNPLKIDKYYYTYNITFLPNYEKISTLFDAIYINPYLDNAFKEYSIPTLIITNPDKIEYYKPIDKENELIIKTNKEENIPKLNEDYFKYYNYIESQFKEIEKIDYCEFIKELNILRNIIKNDKNNLYNNLNFNINNDINNKKLLEAVTNNIFREKYLLKQKVLHK